MRRIPYPCSGCGACCRHVKGVLPAREDGSCIHLVADICTIYEDRPEVCRVDLMIDRHEDSQQRYEDNIAACNLLQEAHGIDKSYRLDK